MGVIRDGADADILLIDGNPIKDLLLFKDKHNILLIMKDGEINQAFAMRKLKTIRKGDRK